MLQVAKVWTPRQPLGQTCIWSENLSLALSNLIFEEIVLGYNNVRTKPT